MKRLLKIILWSFISFMLLALIAIMLFFGILHLPSNRHNYNTIEQIPTPSGFERTAACSGSFAEYLRSLPLKPRGGKTELYTGGTAQLQFLTYAAIDMPIISNDEQCADMCIRLRSEYLYQSSQAHKISFMNVNGERMRFSGGDHTALTSYLRRVYGLASTYSLRRELKPRELKDVQPGDILVFDSSRFGGAYGHAITIADVAINPTTGKIALLFVEGSLPACSLHIIENWNDIWHSPWFIYDSDATNLPIFIFSFKSEDLRAWE